MAKELTWKDAIEKVLEEAATSMHYKEIAEQIVALGLREKVGATPSATVAAQLSMSIANLGTQSPFVKVGKGEYILRKSQSSTDVTGPAVKREESEEQEDRQYDIISSFGMFWRRDFVQWVASPRLLGMQQIGAEPVDFNRQLGIYLLYDGREVIYVGRATERPLGRRLFEHTIDRMSSRWDRFSWFGVLPVSDKGELLTVPEGYKSSRLIPALEAILIEALEPRQNRKRGDDLSAVEYLQVEDPEIKKQKIRDTFESVLNKA